ncbi:DUF6887 family protein [Neosynechococcus sphagnicola]|uniref:DUF6887 family protein n=1 Tax=Neosynechococcus sphagnicola TaxID=1501145 RepID=UPI003B832823
MSDEDSKQHFLGYREDKKAFRQYLGRIENCPHKVMTTVDDPDFYAKIQAAVLRQM